MFLVLIAISEKKKTCYIDGSRHCGRPPLKQKQLGRSGRSRCCDGLPECRGSKRCYGDASTDGAFGWESMLHGAGICTPTFTP